MSETRQTLISSFSKNSLELVKIHVNEWKGNQYVDVRIFFLDNPQEPGSEVPTKKGLCLSAELLPDLLKGLRQAQEYLEETPESVQERQADAGE